RDAVTHLTRRLLGGDGAGLSVAPDVRLRDDGVRRLVAAAVRARGGFGEAALPAGPDARAAGAAGRGVLPRRGPRHGGRRRAAGLDVRRAHQPDQSGAGRGGGLEVVAVAGRRRGAVRVRRPAAGARGQRPVGVLPRQLRPGAGAVPAVPAALPVRTLLLRVV